MIKRAFILALAFAATAASAQDTNFAVRISCDFQQQAGAAELPDLTLLQGSAPMIQAAPMRMGRAVAADSLTTCQLVFGPSATSTYYVATNAYLATNSAYYVQLGTIGTNSVPAGSNSPAAWWYSILYYRNGGIYWSGSGRLYIERTTATGANGLVWQEWEAGAAKDDIARGWIALLSNEVASIETGVVNYGTATNTAYRGDWGSSASNLAASAYSLAISNDNAVLRSIRTVPAVAAYAEAGASDLPWLATNGTALILSGLTSGSIGVQVETTNDTGIALYSVAVKDSGGEVLATIHPACDGTRQSASWPWNGSEEITLEISGIATPEEGAESAIFTAVEVEAWRDVSLVGRTNDLADQHLLVDYPTTDRHAANKDYADAAAQAALDLALGEIGTATFNRDLAGFVQRWNPRFDSFASSNSLSTLYGGSTALRLDGNAAQIVPEIKAFSVEAGTVATLTVWSYAGGATNLVPQVTTNLITGPWESKPENVVSATNVDQYTAQVVFTNDAERTLFVRLIDTSGGDSVPVFRVFGGIAFGDGDAITNWPRGDVLGATINPPHTVATNDGLLAFTIGATGSGFPLTNDVSAAGYNVEQVGLLSASSVRAATDVYATNDMSARDMNVRRNLDVTGSGTVDGDLVVSGNFTLIGSATNLFYTVVDIRTNVYGGTNYYETAVYATQVVYQKTIIYTNIITTNQVNTYVNENGTWVATNAEHVLLPHLRDYRDGNAEAIGTWDFAGANLVGLPTQGITNVGGGLSGDGLSVPLSVDWGEATTNSMTNVPWSSLSAAETDPLSLHIDDAAQIGTGLAWVGSVLKATGEGVVTNETDPLWSSWLSSNAAFKSVGASAAGWSILNTNNAPFVSIVVDTNMGAMLNFPLDTVNAVDSMPIVSGTSASITQLVFVARAYAAGGSEWGTVGLKTTFGGSILTNIVTLTNAPTTQTVTLAHAPVSGPCVVPFSWGILPTSTVGTAVGNVRFNVMQARGSW